MSELRKFFLVNRFHPTEPVLACAGVNGKVILLSADNSFIPFSNWKEKETELELGNFDRPTTMEWNVSIAFKLFEFLFFTPPDQKEPP